MKPEIRGILHAADRVIGTPPQVVTCPCGAKNRVSPSAKMLNLKPICGKCKLPIVAPRSS